METQHYNDLSDASDLTLTLLISTLCVNMPMPLIQKFLSYSIKTMLTNHPRVFNKISNNNYSFVIYPYDLPFKFYMEVSNNPKLFAIHKKEQVVASATIKGSLINLLKMLEGTLDGDAAFFSKDIIIEGSTAASVALRNAIDGEQINIINDLSAGISNPSLRNILHNVTKTGSNLFMTLQNKLTRLNSASNYIINKELQEDRLKFNDIFQELDNIQNQLKKINREQIRKKSDYNDSPPNQI